MRELSIEDKLQRHAEILSPRGIGTRGEERFVELMVVEGCQRKVLAQGIVGRETDMECLVAAGGLGQSAEDIAIERALVAEAEVHAEV